MGQIKRTTKSANSFEDHLVNSEVCMYFRVKFFGCFARESTFAVPDYDAKTIETSTDKENYRHSAVDQDHNVIYFCDRNPYVSGMFCYSSNLTSSPGTWRKLPRYVRNIEGYHKAKGRMYFRGTDGNSTFSTETGERIEL